MSRKSSIACAVALISWLAAPNANATTGDVIDDFLAVATNQVWCAGVAGAVWADVDQDGTYETQVVFTTLTGEAQVVPEFTTGKWYFFSFIDNHCGGSAPYVDRGRYKVHFIDMLAPGFVWNDSNTWTFKRVPAVSLKVSHDACYNWDSDRYNDPAVQPYLSVQAYRDTGQVNPIANVPGTGSGSWAPYQFSDSVGIKELYVTTDFCENNIDDLILYDTEQSFPSGGGAPPRVVLLFDTSGSMNWRHDGSSPAPVPERRLSLAKEAAYPFLVMLNDFNAGQAEFGLATFPMHPWSGSTGCNGQIVTPMSTVNAANTNTAISTTIPGLIAEGNTPLLAGVGTATSMLGVATTEQAVVLLSDGYHNCPSTVQPADPAVTALINQLVAQSTAVYTIGFGRPTDVDHPLLETLATQTGGSFHDVTGPTFDPATWAPATDLQATYKSILVDALNLQTGSDPLGVIDTGATLTREVKIHPEDRKLSFFLSWATPANNRLGLTVRASDGQPVPTQGGDISFHQGKTYIVHTVGATFLRQAGKVTDTPWVVEISAGKFAGAEREHYQFSVIMDSRLTMETQVRAHTLTAGAKLLLTAEMSSAGRPLTGLKDIHVRVSRPAEGIGNWFAGNRVTTDELAKMPQTRGAELLPPRLRKSTFLADVRKVAFPRRVDGGRLRLFDDGTHGDARARDGVYTNVFKDTGKEGTYTFHFAATGHTGKKGTFQRERVVQTYLRVPLDPATTVVDVIAQPSRGTKVVNVAVTATPRDALGNAAGPGYAGAIGLETSWGRPLGDLRDNLDGSYTRIFRVPRDVVSALTINLAVAGKTRALKWADVSTEGGAPIPDVTRKGRSAPAPAPGLRRFGQWQGHPGLRYTCDSDTSECTCRGTFDCIVLGGSGDCAPDEPIICGAETCTCGWKGH